MITLTLFTLTIAIIGLPVWIIIYACTAHRTNKNMDEFKDWCRETRMEIMEEEIENLKKELKK